MSIDIFVFNLVLCTIGLEAALTQRGYSSKAIEYSSLLNLTEFIDKTLLIKAIVETEAKQILITVPNRSGKSTNIAMVQKFLEIQVVEGEPVTKSKGLIPVNDTSNYKFFLKNQLKITNQRSIMAKYFGKFPVIHVDFSNKYKIKDSEQSVVLFRQVIHEAFFEHRYLRQSEKLTSKERRYVKKWCDNYGDYEQFYGQDVTNSLYKLAVILYKHYDETQVFVLIDNFDFPTTNAMTELKDAEELYRVVKFNMGIISKLLSADYKYVKKSVVIGTSYTCTAGIYSLEQVKCFRFLEDHTFAPYFGLTKSEADTLFEKPTLEMNMDDIKCASDFYGGFVSSSGQTFYNFHSVFKFLHFGKAESYCLQSRIVRNLNNLLKIRFIREGIENLVKGGDVCMSMYENITMEDIINLNKAISNQRFESHFNVNLLFYFLFEQGYLTFVYPSVEGEATCLRLPNREVRTKVSLKLKEYYDEYFLIEQSYLRKCINFFTKMSPTITINRAHYKMALYWFYKSLEDLIGFVRKRVRKLNIDDVKKIIFSVIFEVNVKENSEFFVDFKETNGIMNIHLFRGKIKYVIDFIANQTSTDVLQQMLEKDCFDDSEIDMKDPRRHVYIGLGVDEYLHPSLSCLTNSKHITDALHIP